jgi:hypothetical protein
MTGVGHQGLLLGSRGTLAPGLRRTGPYDQLRPWTNHHAGAIGTFAMLGADPMGGGVNVLGWTSPFEWAPPRAPGGGVR